MKAFLRGALSGIVINFFKIHDCSATGSCELIASAVRHE